MCNWTIIKFLASLNYTALVALAALVIGYWKYTVAQKWKKNEYASSLLKQLNTEEDLKACCYILDYPARKIVLECRKDPQGKACTLNHYRDDLLPAMIVATGNPRFKDEQILYRDLFDSFFSYLAQVNHACDQELIEPEFVRPLHYWLEKLLVVRIAPDEVGPDVFRAFVLKYHPGVLQLAEKLRDANLIQGEDELHRITEWRKAAPKAKLVEPPTLCLRAGRNFSPQLMVKK